MTGAGSGSTDRGLPPLARREPCRAARERCPGRSTSARAERTLARQGMQKRERVYLRSRGENYNLLRLRAHAVGLPPLARREHAYIIAIAKRARSTSARAERTSWRGGSWFHLQVYLRSRGENMNMLPMPRSTVGLPPLARREPPRVRRGSAVPGSTSARAERTGHLRETLTPEPVYLRSRGENGAETRVLAGDIGLPPLARRELYPFTFSFHL